MHNLDYHETLKGRTTDFPHYLTELRDTEILIGFLIEMTKCRILQLLH